MATDNGSAITSYDSQEGAKVTVQLTSADLEILTNSGALQILRDDADDEEPVVEVTIRVSAH